jgi:ectoine hydroxylase-related dioxygenase (phytanoyl-CoA dioxygenase family)
MTPATGLTAPFSETETNAILERFYRDGCALVPGVLGADECARLRQLTDDAARQSPSFVIRNPEELNLAFVELFIREPIYSLVQKILGPDCRFCAQNVIRNVPGQSISHWHVDDVLEHPLPPDIPRWDARVRLPIAWLSVQVPLSDILTMADGPTEIVPGSHFSGRDTPKENPVFEGRGAEPILCRAGDIYLFNHQVWHRGSPNTGTRTRYLMQLQYGRGDNLAWRLQPTPHTPALDRVLAGADPRLLKVMFNPPQHR